MRLRFIHFVFPRSRVDANRGLLLGIKNILAEPTHGAQQAPGRMSSTIPAASKFSEEKSYDYGTEAARLLNSKVGGRAVTALAGSRGGMQMAARLLKEQQEDLERLLYKYDHSILRSIRVINRTSASSRRGVAEAPPESGRALFEERRLEAMRLRRTCVSADSAKRLEDEADDEEGSRGGLFKDWPDQVSCIAVSKLVSLTSARALSQEVHPFSDRQRLKGPALSKPHSGCRRQPALSRPAPLWLVPTRDSCALALLVTSARALRAWAQADGTKPIEAPHAGAGAAGGDGGGAPHRRARHHGLQPLSPGPGQLRCRVHEPGLPGRTVRALTARPVSAPVSSQVD